MILFVPLAFLAALAGASSFDLPWRLALVAGVPFVAGTALLLLARRERLVIAALVALAVALALLRLDVQRLLQPVSPLSALAADGPPIAAVRGVVVEAPLPRDRAQQVRLRVDAANSGGEWSTTHGVALLTLPPEPPLTYGDMLEVRGKFKPPEAGSPAGYAAALRRQGVDLTVAFPTVLHLGATPPDPAFLALSAIRTNVSSAIEAWVPEPQAALAEGILAGQRTSIPKALTDDLNRSGTSHIVAVSGFNVSIIITLVVFALGGRQSSGTWWQRWLMAVLASAALWGFVALVGPAGSVLRAAAMAQLALIGRAIGRQGTTGGFLLWGGALLAAWQPAIVLDVSWQLSFLGTAGLIWLSAPLDACLVRLLPWSSRWLPGIVQEGLASTIAAQICVLPVLAAVFGRLSIVAPLANVLILPLIPAIMLTSALLVLAATVAPAAAPLLAGLTWVATTLVIDVVQWTAALPHAAVQLPPWSPVTVVAYFGGLVVLGIVLEWRAAALAPEPNGSVAPESGLRSRLASLALACLAGLVCLGWAMAPPANAAEQSALLVDAPAIDEGGLLLAQAASGTRVLVDGGPTAGGAVALLGQYLRPWDRTVDLVILTDPREAYALGLVRVLERYRVGLLVDAVDDYPSAAYRQLRMVAQRRGVPRVVAEPGTVFDASGLAVEVLGSAAPASGEATRVSSNRSAAPAAPVAIRLRAGEFTFILPGDQGTTAGQRALLASPAALESTVLLFPERATRERDAEAVLRAVSPELVVVQGTPPVPRQASAGSDAAPPPRPTPVTLQVADSAPEPTWHRTADDGGLRLAIGDDGYALVPSR